MYAVMEFILVGIDDSNIYIDDSGVFSTSWDSHIKLLGTVLQYLWDNGFTVYPSKCELAIKEMYWLVYWF